MSDTSADTPLQDLLANMTAASMEASGLDARSLMLVRIAALVAVDAPPASYLLNLAVADEAGVDGESVRDVFAAVAPIVGTARVASAVGNVVRALGFAELAAEQELADGS
jgi:alkylhydroperoxidase/carboxymuconolactone decarboxylase family protein YurZ